MLGSSFHRNRPNLAHCRTGVKRKPRSIWGEGTRNSSHILVRYLLCLARSVCGDQIQSVAHLSTRGCEDDAFSIRYPQRPPVAAGQEALPRGITAGEVLHPDVHAVSTCHSERQVLAVGRECRMVILAGLCMQRFKIASAIEPEDRPIRPGASEINEGPGL